MRKLYWIAFAILFSISACTKIDSTTIGTGLIPPVDGVTTLDTTLDVITENFKSNNADSLLVYKNDDHVIGIIKDDPIFGKTTAKVFFELKPTFYPFYFSGQSSIEADSAVLILSYKGTFGDSTMPQRWEVREMIEAIEGDSTYPITKAFTTGQLLGTKDINPKLLDDSVNYGFENAANQIRIKLSHAFANRLIKEYDSTNAYQSDSVFSEKFKGFAIAPAAGSAGNALIRINLLDSNTKLALFYNYQVPDSAQGKRDTTVTYFRFNSGIALSMLSGNANYIKRDYTASAVQAAWNTTGNSEYAYIQAAPGSFTTVKVPGLAQLNNAIIHRAELLAYQVPDVTGVATTFGAPGYVLLSSYDSSKNIKTNVPNDYIISSGVQNIATFGGYLQSKNTQPPYNEVSAYTYDISRYVQGIVTRHDPVLTLRLTAPVTDSLRYTSPYPTSADAGTFLILPSTANSPAAGRVRLGGGALPAEHPLRMRLRIIYSRI